MVDYAFVTSEGGREVNEDSVNIVKRDENHYCFLLADGLGGHGLGDVASSLAVKNSQDVYMAFCEQDNVLGMIFEAAQKRVLYEQERRRAHAALKTTLTALIIENGAAKWGHIGDSRIYCFQNDAVRKRTKDHSVPQMLVDMGRITEDQIRNHPDRNRLLRVIGEEWSSMSYQLEEPFPVTQGMAFLLSSDGFWELITEEEMIACMKRHKSAEGWLNDMAAIVKQRGAGKRSDNYSAIVVRIR